MTTGLWGWVSDEVTVAGQRMGSAGGAPTQVVVAVKNVPSMADGNYLLDASPAVAGRPVVEANDKFLEVRPLDALTLKRFGDIGYVISAPWIFNVDAGDAQDTLDDIPQGSVSAFVEEESDVFRVHLVHADFDRDRWVRVGVVDIGPGSQSSARSLALIAMPVTIAWDVYTWPLGVATVVVYTLMND